MVERHHSTQIHSIGCPLNLSSPLPIQLGWSLSSRGDGSKKVIAVPSSDARERATDEAATSGEVVDAVNEAVGSDKEQIAFTVKDDKTEVAVKEEDAVVGEGESGVVGRDLLEVGLTSSMPLLGQTKRLVQELTLNFQALVAQHMAVSITICTHTHTHT